MCTYTDEQLAALVQCPKQIVDPPALKMKPDRGSKRNGMTLQSQDGNHRFRVFMRQSEDFEEDFSIGLGYLPKDASGSFCLLRCNGKHGGHQAHPHHLSFHVHRVIADDVNNGNNQERHVEVTTEYASYRDGLAYFLKLINLILSQEESNRYFPSLLQQTLFDGLDSPLTESSNEST